MDSIPISFAERLADAARAVSLPWLQEAKADGSDVIDKNEGGAIDPVTEADRGAERAMRALIEAEFPDHGIWGEEYGLKEGTGPYQWSLDPIDGTRAFICGLPGWTTLIALLENGRQVLGIIDAPRMDEMAIGHGDQAWLVTGGVRTPIRTSGCKTLAQARMATTDPFIMGDGTEAFTRVREKVRLTRYGYDAYAYSRLAAGAIDLVIENGLQPHDYNALIPVVRGAGGWTGNWQGGEEVSGALVAAASRELFEAAVAALEALEG